MPGLPREKRAARSPEPAQDSDDFRKPCGAADGLGDTGWRGRSPSTGREVGAGQMCSQGRAEVTLTGLVAHAAEDGPHLHLEVSLSLLQALVH